MADSFLPGRSNNPFGAFTNVNQLVAISQKIDPTVPVVLTTNSGITNATYAIHKLTYADILASYENGSNQVCGIYGSSPYSVYTDANGYATVNVVPPGPAASAMPQLALASYASSIDADSILGTTQAPFTQLSQSFAVRAATTGTVTAGVTNTSKNLVIASLGTATVVTIGALVTGTDIPNSTFIVSQTSGTTGGAGTYVMSNAATGTVASESVVVGLQPVTVTQGTTVGQSCGLQYNNADGSFLLDFSAAVGGVVCDVTSVNEQDPFYNLLSNACLVDVTFLSTLNQATTQYYYST